MIAYLTKLVQLRAQAEQITLAGAQSDRPAAAGARTYPGFHSVVEGYNLSTGVARLGGDVREQLDRLQSLGSNGVAQGLPSELDRMSRSKLRVLHEHIKAGVQRPRDVLEFIAAEGFTARYVQTFGHVEPRQNDGYRVVADTTLSSEALKKEAEAPPEIMVRAFNANLGHIKRDDALLLVRSARSDTPERILELMLYGAAHAGPEQLSVDPQHPGVPLYRPVIISAMDISWRKACVAQVIRLFGGHAENERRYLAHQAAAVESLFGKHTSIRRRIDGREVSIARPLLFNLPFSAQADNPSNIRLARKRNEPAALALFGQLMHLWGADASCEARQKMGAQMAECVDDAARRQFVTGLVPEQLDALPDADVQALQLLRLTLTNCSIDGKEHLEPTAPSKDLALLRIAMRQCRMVPHVQCKSGQDRTLTKVSLLVAADMMELEGHTLSPLSDAQDPRNLQRDGKYFTAAAVNFGPNSIMFVRGHGKKGRVKWRLDKSTNTHAVPRALFTPSAGSALGLSPKKS